MLAAARSGSSAVLVLRGEPGIGKSALLQYAVGSAAGMRVLSIVGTDSELGLSFAALHQLLTPLLDGIEDLPAPQRDALGSAFGLVAGVPADRFLVGLAVLTLLSTAAEKQPVVCVVDDAQWLDGASAGVLAFVARRLDAEAIVLLFAVGEPAETRTPLDGLPELRLSGLSDSASGELLAGAVTSPLDDHVRDRVISELHGNPLALLDLPTELTAAELVGAVPLPEPLPLGERLERSFLRRVRRLPRETQALLLLIAVEPRGGDNVLWRAADDIGIARSAIAPAESGGLLTTGPPVRFRHSLARAVVYGAASADERREAHRAFAAATDPKLEPERRAWHRAAASIGPDEDVASELERSAVRARDTSGYAAAAVLLERAAQLSPVGEPRAVRSLAAAQAELVAGAPAKASALLAEASSDLGDELQRAQAQRLRGALALTIGNGDEAPAMLLEAARALEALDIRLARDTYLDALEAAMYTGRLGSRGALLDAARAARAAPPVPPSQWTPADLLLDGFASLLIEDRAAGLKSLRRAIETIRDESDPRWVGLAFHAANELWDDEALHALTTRHVRLARDTGALTVLTNALSQLGWYEVVVGRFDAAEACFDEGREISTAIGNPGIIGQTDPGALIVAAWRGLDAETRALAEASMQDATTRGIGTLLGFAHYGLAVLELGLGRYGPALIAAQEASVDALVTTRALPELVEAAARSGELDVAAEAVRRLADSAVSSGTEWGLGTLARSQALASRNGEAEQLYLEAIDHLDRCRARPQLARARLVYGEWLRRKRRRRKAREQLRAAHEMFESMGAEAFARRAATELLATGEHARPRTAEKMERLTPHERRIARLVSEGATNAEVAAQLFVSPRTVEYHLGKIFRKLGISSRTRLARALVQLEHKVD